MEELHQVVMKLLNSDVNTSIIIAGTGCPEITSNMLMNPHGIFVDINYNLYVTDSDNNRIQFFSAGQPNGTTIAENGAPGSISLYSPTRIVLDADGNLFIVHQKDHRIVRSSLNEFRCSVGCTNLNGSASNQLLYQRALCFYSIGNILVTNANDNRIQKFLLITNSCGQCHNTS